MGLSMGVNQYCMFREGILNIIHWKAMTSLKLGNSQSHHFNGTKTMLDIAIWSWGQLICDTLMNNHRCLLLEGALYSITGNFGTIQLQVITFVSCQKNMALFFQCCLYSLPASERAERRFGWCKLWWIHLFGEINF